MSLYHGSCTMQAVTGVSLPTPRELVVELFPSHNSNFVGKLVAQ